MDGMRMDDEYYTIFLSGFNFANMEWITSDFENTKESEWTQLRNGPIRTYV